MGGRGLLYAEGIKLAVVVADGALVTLAKFFVIRVTLRKMLGFFTLFQEPVNLLFTRFLAVGSAAVFAVDLRAGLRLALVRFGAGLFGRFGRFPLALLFR